MCIRDRPNSEAWLFLGQALGANPTPISFSELYLALQTGVVDGQDNPLPSVESAKFYEVQKSITMTNHLVDSVWPAINLQKWESLTDAQKDIIMQGVEAGRKYCDETNPVSYTHLFVSKRHPYLHPCHFEPLFSQQHVPLLLPHQPIVPPKDSYFLITFYSKTDSTHKHHTNKKL